MPRPLLALGTDGFGRSESRASLRDFFEVDAKHIVLATLHALAKDKQLDAGSFRRPSRIWASIRRNNRKSSHGVMQASGDLAGVERDDFTTAARDSLAVSGERSVTEFKLPELGENVEQGDLVRLMISPGTKITEGQPVMELETDKAVIEVPVVLYRNSERCSSKEGDKIKVGQVIFTFENGGSGKPRVPLGREEPPPPAAVSLPRSDPAAASPRHRAGARTAPVSDRLPAPDRVQAS